MDEIEQQKPVAYVKWADEEKKAEGGGMSYGVETQGIPVWLKMREDSLMFSWMRAVLHPGSGPKDAQLLVVCPRCGLPDLRIPGHTKTFEWELLGAPRMVPVPGNPDAVNLVRLSLVEDWGCPRCRQMFRLTTNVISKA